MNQKKNDESGQNTQKNLPAAKVNEPIINEPPKETKTIPKKAQTFKLETSFVPFIKPKEQEVSASSDTTWFNEI